MQCKARTFALKFSFHSTKTSNSSYQNTEASSLDNGRQHHKEGKRVKAVKLCQISIKHLKNIKQQHLILVVFKAHPYSSRFLQSEGFTITGKTVLQTCLVSDFYGEGGQWADSHRGKKPKHMEAHLKDTRQIHHGATHPVWILKDRPQSRIYHLLQSLLHDGMCAEKKNNLTSPRQSIYIS